MKIENVGFPVREPMLADGKVDAITGFSFSMHFNLLQKGLKPEDIKTMLMADHGLVLYGNAIMVNPDYAKANPKVVAGFVRATIKGVLDTIKDPDAAIKSVMKRNDTGDEKIELDRLKMSLRDNFVTPWVKANGFGGVDMARLAKSIEQIALTYDFKNRPKAEDIFTSAVSCRRRPTGSCDACLDRSLAAGHARAKACAHLDRVRGGRRVRAARILDRPPARAIRFTCEAAAQGNALMTRPSASTSAMSR